MKNVLYEIVVLIFAVAPYVGAWIETLWVPVSLPPYLVAPYVGAWIETLNHPLD